MKLFFQIEFLFNKGGASIFRKVLVLLSVALISMLFILPQNSPLRSVFRVSETPMIITKGHYGHSYVLEISFSHDNLFPWLEQLKAPLPLLLLDAKWIQRSSDEIEFIKEKQFPVGLLGQKQDDYESLLQLQEEIDLFKETFGTKPLWFTTQDHSFTDEMKNYLFAEEINILAPSIKWQANRTDFKLKKGMIVAIPFHEETKVDWENVNKFIHENKFLPMEENLFGYTVKTKSFP